MVRTNPTERCPRKRGEMTSSCECKAAGCYAMVPPKWWDGFMVLSLQGSRCAPPKERRCCSTTSIAISCWLEDICLSTRMITSSAMAKVAVSICTFV